MPPTPLTDWHHLFYDYAGNIVLYGGDHNTDLNWVYNIRLTSNGIEYQLVNTWDILSTKAQHYKRQTQNNVIVSYNSHMPLTHIRPLAYLHKELSAVITSRLYAQEYAYCRRNNETWDLSSR